MPQVTVQDVEQQAAALVRSVREEKIEYVIVEHGEPVAMLTPIPAGIRLQDPAPTLALVETWLNEEAEDDEMPFDEFLQLIEQNRLDLHVEA